MQKQKSLERRRDHGRRWARLAPVVTVAFTWSFILAPIASGAQEIARSNAAAQARKEAAEKGHVTKLSNKQMEGVVGAQAPTPPVSTDSGNAYP